MSETRQHAQVAQTLKRWVKPLSRNNNDMKMDLANCDASLLEKHDSISAVSTAVSSPVTSFGSEESDEGTTHHVVQDLGSWITQQPEQTTISGKWRDEEQERKVLPRTSSECSEYWTRIQEETRPRSRASSIAAGTDHSTDYDFRPRTPTVFNEYHGECHPAAPAVCTAIVSEAALLRRNSELEDRVAELERKLLELASQKGVA